MFKLGDALSPEQLSALLHLAGINQVGQVVLLKMMVRFPAATRWWEPWFAGYGGAPDFELFRLRLLGWHESNFTAHGRHLWPASREQSQQRFLAARSWADLFTAS